MFAAFKTEVRAMVADAFDLAIEFATLGEYRLPGSDRATMPPVTYPSFEGLPVRGGARSSRHGERSRARAGARGEHGRRRASRSGASRLASPPPLPATLTRVSARAPVDR